MLGATLTARWLTTLTIGPLLGALITEPAAMTISALVLANNLYELAPSRRFKYATLGLLFVNISVGGTETHFTAPPVLMVAETWNWTTGYMLTHFGWKAIIDIVLSNGLYFFIFRREIKTLEEKFVLVHLKEEIQENHLGRRDMDAMFDDIAKELNQKTGAREIIEAEIRKLEQAVEYRLEAHYFPKLLTSSVQPNLIRQAFKKRFGEFKLRQMRRAFPALLPSHQQGPFVDPDWDKRDDPVPVWVTVMHLMFMAWTIANAPNPAGVSILKKYFNDEVAPLGILLGALIPTPIMLMLFMLLA